MAGNVSAGHFWFDLLEVIMVNLPNKIPEKETEPTLNGMLKTLFSPELKKEEIIKRLEEVYHIPKNQKLEGGIQTMCNFGEAILERGIEQGKAQGIEEGEARVNRLIQLLLEQSRSDEIERAVSDKEYQKKLFEEFGLF